MHAEVRRWREAGSVGWVLSQVEGVQGSARSLGEQNNPAAIYGEVLALSRGDIRRQELGFASRGEPKGREDGGKS